MDQFVLSEATDGEVTLTCRGDLDLLTRAQLGSACHDALGASTRRLVVDLDDVDFLDSGSVRLLDQAAYLQDRQGGVFTVVCTNDALRRVLRLTGFSARHRLFPQERSARLSWRDRARPSARRAAR
ncbi:MAG TPA: anti-sigma factor antagonist [Nocardioides sp.]|nr:anti-sigma factor antagonist [Nocardioides sp.]